MGCEHARLDFLYQWLGNDVPETAAADVVSIDEVTHKRFADAKSVGIKWEEIDEEVTGQHRVFWLLRHHALLKMSLAFGAAPWLAVVKSQHR
ncbi:DUF768 domain-containing protein [Mesorhizobium sp. AR07]|nr:DUF768 domain-containing protein [Mesorhizobium sp. AR07]